MLRTFVNEFVWSQACISPDLTWEDERDLAMDDEILQRTGI